MVIRNYHWLNSASLVLISTCSAPLVQTGERKQFSLFDLDLWHTTLTYNTRLAKVKVDLHAKNQGHRSNGWNRRAPTDKRTDTHWRYQTYYRPRYAVDKNCWKSRVHMPQCFNAGQSRPSLRVGALLEEKRRVMPNSHCWRWHDKSQKFRQVGVN